ncbi:MAG: hypothetical protein L0H53_14875 [Candidatus Nitrosocosmicus sp.]|nr:hypothetical protein [Candidatus Nitrosocosmicus sp.]
MSLSKNRVDLMVFSLILISLICSVFTFTELNLLQLGPLVSAQIANSDPIEIISTSTFTDDLGNFHFIGEVNNTSTQSQTDIVITGILSDTTNNAVIGNHSVFTSINTLRTGELSPFDIVIQDPQQILGKFNFIEFSATSQHATEEKPASLVINGSSSFLDNAGNPHIIGNIINQGQTPEQFLNLVATFYDNSSLGVIGTQTFGLNVGNLANNQMVSFDITITDNKTKSQGAFYSLNVQSTQSSMSEPLNTKTSFVSSNGIANGDGDGLVNNSPMTNQPEFVNSNDDDSNTRGNDDADDDEDDNEDNQRGEKKTDDKGNPWFDDENCSEESGSSGGSSSECEEAEREEESEREDEDSLEKDQGPPSNSDSDSTNDNNNESEDHTEDVNEDN